MSQDCLFHGHKPVRMAGAGPFEGRWFVVCSECGMTWPEGAEPPHIRQQVRGEAAVSHRETEEWRF